MEYKSNMSCDIKTFKLHHHLLIKSLLVLKVITVLELVCYDHGCSPTYTTYSPTSAQTRLEKVASSYKS